MLRQRHLHTTLLTPQMLARPSINDVIAIPTEPWNFTKLRRHRPRLIQCVHHSNHSPLLGSTSPVLRWVIGIERPVRVHAPLEWHGWFAIRSILVEGQKVLVLQDLDVGLAEVCQVCSDDQR